MPEEGSLEALYKADPFKSAMLDVHIEVYFPTPESRELLRKVLATVAIYKNDADKMTQAINAISGGLKTLVNWTLATAGLAPPV